MQMRPGFWDYLLVIVQVLLIGIYLFMPGAFADFLIDAMRFIGAAPMVIGGILIIWALIQLKDNLRILPTPGASTRLITRGIFKYIRHPIYAGIILLAFGYAIYHSSFHHLLMALAIFIFFDIKATYEEKRMMRRFHEYWDYKVRTGKFFPMRIQVKDTDKAYDAQDVPLDMGEEDEEGKEARR